MPTHDGGHYFLTVLAPIRVELTPGPVVGWSRSDRQSLAQKLALLATGRQTAASPEDDPPSPFARNSLNHLARLVIVDGPNYNGRLSGDALISQIRKDDPLIAQPVDRLTSPFLLFAADIDAQGADGEAALRAYTDALWATMQTDLVQIFGHCIGFDGVQDADGFHGYIKRCQLETTMPFNDYWLDGLPVAKTKLPIIPLVGAVLVAGILLVWMLSLPILALLPIWIVLAALAIFGLLRWIERRSESPFPTAPGSDLPTVLKSLYLQQEFARFAVEAQGLDDGELHARFGRFLGAVRPGEAHPTQAAGDVRAPATEWSV